MIYIKNIYLKDILIFFKKKMNYFFPHSKWISYKIPKQFTQINVSLNNALGLEFIIKSENNYIFKAFETENSTSGTVKFNNINFHEREKITGTLLFNSSGWTERQRIWETKELATEADNLNNFFHDLCESKVDFTLVDCSLNIHSIKGDILFKPVK